MFKFKNPVVLSAMLSSALLACGGPGAEELDEAAPEESTEGALIPLPTCTTQAADATMTVEESPAGYYFGHVDSNGTAYTNLFCSSFVVDVIVPGGYTAGGPLVENAFTLGGN